MKKFFGSGLVLLFILAVVTITATPVMARELMVCIVDKKIPDNIVLPGEVFALPGSKVRCSLGIGTDEDTFETTMKALYLKRWTLIDVQMGLQDGKAYGIYYLDK
jgi:hypothetical protein